MRGRFRCKFRVQVETPGGVIVDRFGDERPAEPETHQVAVFGWAIVKVAETVGDSVLRTVDELQLYAPPDAPITPASVVVINGQRWKVNGIPDNYEHNPWFAPGLVLVHCRKVDG